MFMRPCNFLIFGDLGVKSLRPADSWRQGGLAAAGRIDYGCFNMKPEIPPPAAPPSGGPAPAQAPKRRPWLLYGCGGLLALLFVVVATVALTVWWVQRPIKPVVLSAAEKATVEEKLQHLGGAAGDGSRAVAPATPGVKPEADRPYTPGSKVLKLTEREVNGLLNENTEMGQAVRLEFGRDAINAYLAVRIPEDFPVGGGKMFRARGRFRVSLGDGKEPYAILEDVTVFGLSLPKAWLAGLKGENLLAKAMGERNGAPVFRGVKSLRVEPGALVLEVEE